MKLFSALFITLMATMLFSDIVKKIEYKGLVHISKPVALRMLQFDVGDEIDPKQVDNAVQAYFKQGYFKDIWVSFDAGELVFNFVEKAIISKVELKGWKDDDEEIMASVVQIKKGTLYDMKKLEQAKKRIIQAMSQDGKIDSVVEIETEHLDNGSMKVTFVANEGGEILIEKLRYSGVKALDSDDFDDVIANKEHQFMGWFWGRNSGKMKLKDLEYDNLRIRDFYMQNGYLDSKVDKPFVRVNFDNYTADMSYEIFEGQPYTIQKITIEQAKDVATEAEIREKITLKKGEVFNIKTFREDAEKIKTLIADKSYAFVQVVPDLRKDEKKHTVEVVFKVMPGSKVKIRNVLISGNNRTLDRVVRRELYLGPGDMYSLTDLKDSRNSLGRLGYFDSNTIEEKRIDDHTMDLMVKVKEAPTGNIQLGGGYGSYGGLLVNIGVNDRNIWGSGINVGVKAEKSQVSKSYSFSISNPRLNDSDYSGNFSIFHSAYDYNSYTVITDGLSFGTGHRFTRNITGYVGYGYSKNSYEFAGNFNSSLYGSQSFFEAYDKSAITVSAKWDSTDDFYLPREGFELSQSLEFAGVGAKAKFVKSKTNFSIYKGMAEYLNFDAIFRYKARFYTMFDNGYIPLAEKFYMGGIGSVRGYQSYSLSPMVADSTGYDSYNGQRIRRVGGTATFSNNLEMSLPLVPSAKMRLVTFVDWGVITDNITSNLVNENMISRGGYGAGIEWFSPVGPIQLMFAKPLLDKPDDKTSVFEFTMGQRF